MAHKYLGEYFDIHCGGEDHHRTPPQRNFADGSRLRHQAHFLDASSSFILLNSAKMSKSSGEFLRVQLLIDKDTIRSLIGIFA